MTKMPKIGMLALLLIGAFGSEASAVCVSCDSAEKYIGKPRDEREGSEKERKKSSSAGGGSTGELIWQKHPNARPDKNKYYYGTYQGLKKP